MKEQRKCFDVDRLWVVVGKTGQSSTGSQSNAIEHPKRDKKLVRHDQLLVVFIQ
jgi:hypothetical protein